MVTLVIEDPETFWFWKQSIILAEGNCLLSFSCSMFIRHHLPFEARFILFYEYQENEQTEINP